MTSEDQERLHELEQLVEDGEELDEDDRDELKELRSEAREEKRTAKALAKFDKAGTVFRVNTPDDTDGSCFYVLDLATAQKWAGEGCSIEEVDRKSLTGRFRSGILEGFFGSGDDWGREQVYIEVK